MKEKGRNKDKKPLDFLRYRSGEMNDLEKNAFEKRLQRDPFAEEAMEGFSEISADEAASDLRRLEKQIKSRVSKKSRMIYYRIAASVAVLMILSSVFIVIEKIKPSQQISDLSGEKSLVEITEPKAIAIPAPEVAIKEDRSGGVLSTREKAARQEEMPAISKKQDIEIQSSDKNIEGIAKKSEGNSKTMVKDMELNAAEKMAVARAAPVTSKPVAGITVRGKIISADDNLPLPGATVRLEGSDKAVLTDKNGNFSIEVPSDTSQKFIAEYIGMEPKEFSAKSNKETEVKMASDIASLSEVVVVGYGTNIKSGRMEDETSGYLPPSPVIGRNNFNKYIENNIRKPSILAYGKRAVVVLSFEIKSTGVVDSINIIRSPDKVYSDEAIRLIREGPAWKPASSNGVNIDDDVRLRIVFK
jgi:hypothetical protein